MYLGLFIGNAKLSKLELESTGYFHFLPAWVFHASFFKSGFKNPLKCSQLKYGSYTKKMPLHLFGNDVLMFHLDQAS